MDTMRKAAVLLLRDIELLAAVIMLGGLGLLALLGPLVWGRDPLAIDIGATLQPPSAQHLMGTDSVGRDVFARFMAGAGISLGVGLAVVMTGSLLGGLIGALAGLIGGWVDAILMRLMDIILAFPPLILAMAVAIALGPSIFSASVGIVITSVPWYARVLRSEVVRIRAMPFVEAAAALGAGRARVIWRHIGPHVLPGLLIQAAASFGYSILTLAALSFVGLGAKIPTPEWGVMITDGFQSALTGSWWIGVFPGLGLLAAVSGANLLADRARDWLDPRGEISIVEGGQA